MYCSCSYADVGPTNCVVYASWRALVPMKTMKAMKAPMKAMKAAPKPMKEMKAMKGMKATPPFLFSNAGNHFEVLRDFGMIPGCG